MYYSIGSWIPSENKFCLWNEESQPQNSSKRKKLFFPKKKVAQVKVVFEKISTFFSKIFLENIFKEKNSSCKQCLQKYSKRNKGGFYYNGSCLMWSILIYSIWWLNYSEFVYVDQGKNQHVVHWMRNMIT